MAAKKKPSPAQLAARAKFTAMVKAKAAARKKAANKPAVKKIGGSLTSKYFIEYLDQGIKQTKYYKSIPLNAVKHNGFYKIEIKGILLPLLEIKNRQPVKISGWFKGSTAFIEQNEKKPINANSVQLVTRRKITKAGTFKDFTKVSGLDKVVMKGNKTNVLYTRLSGLFDTSIISDIDQLKKEYFKLAKKYHPDAGGTKEQFQMLQSEYENLLKKLLSGSKLSSEQQNNEIILDEALRKAIDAIIGLPNISIELVGKWIWISGNTYPLRNELKAAGFMFAPKKKMWYYKGTESSGRGDLSMEEIKSKYGSTKIMPKDSGKFISGFGKITRAQRAKFKANLLKATKAMNKRVV